MTVKEVDDVLASLRQCVELAKCRGQSEMVAAFEAAMAAAHQLRTDLRSDIRRFPPTNSPQLRVVKNEE